VVDVLEDAFTFMLMAYTQQHITLPRKPVGSRVNLEVDIPGKYVERFIREAQDAYSSNEGCHSERSEE
jgi:riboflavin synthase